MITRPLADFLATQSAAWETLIAAQPAAAFFQRVEWLATWAAHPTAPCERFVALRESVGRLEAGLPLQLGQGHIGRWKLAKLEVLGSPWLDRVDVARRDDAQGEAFLDELLDWLVGPSKGWTVFDLREATAGGFLIETLARLAAARRLRVERRVCSRSPCFDFGAAGTRAPSSNLRSQLSRGGKRLAAVGRVDVAFLRPTPETLDALLEECAVVERLSWKGKTATGILALPDRAAFFRPLFHALSASGRFAIGTLRVDGVLHAYHLGFLHEGAFLSYNLANRPEQQEHGPGTLLLQAMAEQGATLGVTVLDASRGEIERPHLLHRYGGPVRDHEQLLIWRPGVRGATVHLARTQLLPRLRKLRRKSAATPAKLAPA